MVAEAPGTPRAATTTRKGKAKPRIAPPVPARHDLAGFRQTAESLGIGLYPWQEVAARYITATDRDGGHLYHEVAIVVARQNGKTTLAKPLIIRALLAGKKVMHIANRRELPRHMFGVVADALSGQQQLFPTRRGKIIWPRYGAGSEEIILRNGGEYRIVASRNGSARGWTNDLVIIDELREMDSFDVIEAAAPTMRTTNGQMIYLSNAGSEKSVVLNAVRSRGLNNEDPDLAYLEWSAPPEASRDDMDGWLQANPAIGHDAGTLRSIQRDYRSAMLSGVTSGFETETLCRWVASMDPPIVTDVAWARCHGDLGPVKRARVAISVDPSGARVSAVACWQQPDGSIGVRVLADVSGSPVSMELLGPELRKKVMSIGAIEVGYDPWTDAELAKYFPKSRVIAGRDYAAASTTFVRAVESRRIRWDEASEVTDDLPWITREEKESGSWIAVKATDARPVTAGLAAIRASWLASTPMSGEARIY